MRRRDRVERALYQLRNALRLIDMTALRIRQALQRVALDDLLCPAIEQLDKVVERLDRVEITLTELWQEGETDGWS